MGVRQDTPRRARLRMDQVTGELVPIPVFESNGCWRKWTGTREQLIAAGLCKAAQFPEGRKRQKYGDGMSYLMKCKAGGRFEYLVWPSKEEQEEIRKQEKESTPHFADAEAFREGLQLCLVASPGDLLDAFGKKPSAKIPFRLGTGVYDEVCRKLFEIQELIKEAKITDIRPKVPAEKIAAAKSNGRLQHFLNHIQGREAA